MVESLCLYSVEDNLSLLSLSLSFLLEINEMFDLAIPHR